MVLRYYLGITSASSTGLSPSTVMLSSHVPLASFIPLLVALQPHLCRNMNGLGCSHFDRLYFGNHCCFLFLRLLRCFSSPGLPPLRDDTSSRCRVAPFGNPWIIECLASTHGFSQLTTSFFASRSLGIHRVPLVTSFVIS